jgi:hypothetical protein
VTTTPLLVGVLDDYQNAARESAPWSELGDAADVTIFNDHITGTGSVVARLAPFDVVVAMRERTRFPRQVLERPSSPSSAVTRSASWPASSGPGRRRPPGAGPCGRQGTC